jgi:hypothetical protein
MGRKRKLFTVSIYITYNLFYKKNFTGYSPILSAYASNLSRLFKAFAEEHLQTSLASMQGAPRMVSWGWTTSMTSGLNTLLELRVLVGFLGERSQYGWWPTAFYESSSRQFLEPVFAKTSRSAQYHGVVAAARHLHDQHLSVGSFHLFRLPEEIEQDLHKLLQDGTTNSKNIKYQGKDNALNFLNRLAVSAPKGSEGPVAIGEIKDVSSTRVLGAIAGAYVWAFSRNTKTYPYLVG